MEAHLVATVPTDVADCWDPDGNKVNCLVVFSTLFEASPADVQNTFIASLFDASAKLGTADISDPDEGTYGVWSVDSSSLSVSSAGGKEAKALGELDLAELMPSSMDYYYWNGSLTTPTCDERVTWIMFQNPQSVSAAQVEQLADNFGNNNDLCRQNCDGISPACALLCLDVGATTNNRPTQDLNDRVVLDSLTTICPDDITALHRAPRKVAPGEEHTLTLTWTR
ncbi:unnamed protein product [Ostreobium quekettii]|uniref:carbonic anhydrase n=1 Tax=Ostreobium quekettii TaxID=121088 RepID=A0A8S1ILG3_9CHLO|nr:unnamed protein product [Ostreobium quekettii]